MQTSVFLQDYGQPNRGGILTVLPRLSPATARVPVPTPEPVLKKAGQGGYGSYVIRSTNNRSGLAAPTAPPPLRPAFVLLMLVTAFLAWKVL